MNTDQRDKIDELKARGEKIVRIVDQKSYVTVFTKDNVGHLMPDGTIVWEST